MRTPAALRKLDDKVLGDRFRSGDGEHEHRDAAESRSADAASRGRSRDDAEPYPDEPRTRTVERTAAPTPNTGDGLREVLAITYRVSSLVFLALALAVGLGILFTVVSTNGDNAIVSTVLNVAEAAAGPFRDVFTAGDEQRQLVTNYGFAAGLYLLAAVLVTKLPGGKQ